MLVMVFIIFKYVVGGSFSPIIQRCGHLILICLKNLICWHKQKKLYDTQISASQILSKNKN